MNKHALLVLCALLVPLPAMAEEVFVPIDSAPVHKFTISNYGKHSAGVSAASPGGANWIDVNAIEPMKAESWNFNFCRVDYLITWDDGTTKEFHQDTCKEPNLDLNY